MRRASRRERAHLPVIDALSRLCREDNGGRVAETIRHHAPTWLAQMPALLDDADSPAPAPTAQGATQPRMLRELAEAIDGSPRIESSSSHSRISIGATPRRLPSSTCSRAGPSERG